MQEDPQESTSTDVRDDEAAMPPDDAFNMIVQAPWEEDIVWSSDDYKPSKQSIAAQNRAGWVPSGNIRTLQGYLTHAYRKGEFTIDILKL